MALGEAVLTQLRKYGIAVPQDAELVCNGRLALSNAQRSLLLRQPAALHEMRKALRFVDIVGCMRRDFRFRHGAFLRFRFFFFYFYGS